jgi:hypothetical protein
MYRIISQKSLSNEDVCFYYAKEETGICRFDGRSFFGTLEGLCTEINESFGEKLINYNDFVDEHLITVLNRFETIEEFREKFAEYLI